MAHEDDPGDDLTVRLEWPDDPLVRSVEPVEPVTSADVEDRIDRLQKAIDELPHGSIEPAALESAIVRLEYVAAETVQALKDLQNSMRGLLDERMAGQRTAIMSMLASRQAEDQSAIRRDRDALIAKIESVIAGSVGDIATELRALRRRLQVQANAKGGRALVGGDEVLEDLVQRVADEVEIRVSAAKTKPSRRAKS